MKKLLIAVLALGVFALVATSAQAEEKYVAGGFEASGHVMTGAGYQYVGKNNNPSSSYQVNDGDTNYNVGVLGKYDQKAMTAKSNHFDFFVDEVELDIAKSFGENIRLRSDLDFARINSGGQNAFMLEQAYATANVPIGNGVEVLIGRFNTPLGFEAVDVIDNDTISKSALVGIRPAANLTGLKFYYSFSDLVDLHLYVVNNLSDTTGKLNSIPSTGFRLGFNWGEEGSESTVGVSAFEGPSTLTRNGNLSYGGDLDFNWWITESFAIGGEAIFRRYNAATRLSATAQNLNTLGGLLNLHYVFSDVWDGTLKYAYAKQYKGSNSDGTAGGYSPLGGGFAFVNAWPVRQSVQQISLAGGYAVADGAKLKLEGRFDMVKPMKNDALYTSGTQYTYGGALAFGYNF